MVEDGYEFFAKRQLVTIFSAPNYCGEFDNAGAMMSVDETLMCSFQVCNHSVTDLRSLTLHRVLLGAVLSEHLSTTPCEPLKSYVHSLCAHAC